MKLEGLGTRLHSHYTTVYTDIAPYTLTGHFWQSNAQSIGQGCCHGSTPPVLKWGEWVHQPLNFRYTPTLILSLHQPKAHGSQLWLCCQPKDVGWGKLLGHLEGHLYATASWG